MRRSQQSPKHSQFTKHSPNRLLACRNNCSGRPVLENAAFLGGFRVLSKIQDPSAFLIYPPVREIQKNVILAKSPDNYQKSNKNRFFCGYKSSFYTCLSLNEPLRTSIPQSDDISDNFRIFGSTYKIYGNQRFLKIQDLQQ